MVEFSPSTPAWYSGPQGILKNTFERGQQATSAPYQAYTGQRIADFSPLQRYAFSQGLADAANPAYSQMYARINPALDRAAQNPLDTMGQYMNPYQEEVVNNIGRMASRNLIENILPNVRDRFIKSGQYGSTGHQTMTNRAIRDTQQNVSQAQAQALQSGFNSALNTASDQQLRNMQMAQAIPGVANQMRAGRQAATDQMFRYGTAQQTRDQDILSQAQHDFREQRDYPWEQANRMSQMLHGVPSPSVPYTSYYQPQAPRASMYSQMAGHFMNMYGNMQQPGFKKGGLVRNVQRYADGGQVNYDMPAEEEGNIDPLAQGVNDAQAMNRQAVARRAQAQQLSGKPGQVPYQATQRPEYMQGEYTEDLDALREMAQQLKKPNRDPFWSAYSKLGEQMAMRSYAGDFMGDLGKAASAASQEYRDVVKDQEGRKLQAVNLQGVIGKTHRAMFETKRKEAFQRLQEEGINKRHQDTMGYHYAALAQSGKHHDSDLEARNKEHALDRDMKLMEMGLKYSEDKANPQLNAAIQDANKAELKDIQRRASTTIDVEHALDSLMELQDKLNTGQIRGKIAGVSPALASLTGMGSVKDIQSFNTELNSLVMKLGEGLKGSNVALGKLRMLQQSKPEITNDPESNKRTMTMIKDLFKISKEQDNFAMKAIENGQSAAKAKLAWANWYDDKHKFEQQEANQGVPYPYTPDDWMGGNPRDNDKKIDSHIASTHEPSLGSEKTLGLAKLEELSDEDIDRLIAQQAQ